MRKYLNLIFVLELAAFVLIVLGVLPRTAAIWLALFLAGYAIWAPLEDGILLFIRSIPFFIAIPVTATFDNFNTWRIISAILFLKWFWEKPADEIIMLVKHPITQFRN